MKQRAVPWGEPCRGQGPRYWERLVWPVVQPSSCKTAAMTVRYHVRKAGLNPIYVCQREGIEHAQRICQSIPGSSVDAAIGDLLLEMMTPVTLEVALAVQHELQQRLDDADRLRHQQVERARYEADLAQRRYLQVDPNNRLVAAAIAKKTKACPTSSLLERIQRLAIHLRTRPAKPTIDRRDSFEVSFEETSIWLGVDGMAGWSGVGGNISNGSGRVGYRFATTATLTT